MAGYQLGITGLQRADKKYEYSGKTWDLVASAGCNILYIFEKRFRLKTEI